MSFDSVNVREYRVTVSHNPTVSSGPPVELAWSYNEHDSCDIDEFEAKRCHQRSANFVGEKKMTRLQREMLLRLHGASTKEINEASKQATVLRNERFKSAKNVHKDAFHEKMEQRVDRLKSVFRSFSTSNCSVE